MTIEVVPLWLCHYGCAIMVWAACLAVRPSAKHRFIFEVIQFYRSCLGKIWQRSVKDLGSEHYLDQFLTHFKSRCVSTLSKANMW